MGFSVSASTALIFAALFLAFGTLYPAMANGYERVEEADAAKADHNLDQAQTDIILLDSSVDPGGPDGEIQDLRINITNAGETTLTVSKIDLIIDGEYIEWTNGANDEVITEVEGDQDTDLWLPNETIDIEYDENAGGPFPEPNRFKVITEHGASVSGDV